MAIWDVTTAAAVFNFFGSGGHVQLARVDTNHFLALWNVNGDSWSDAQVLTVNTSTWAVTTAAAIFIWSDDNSGYSKLLQIDSNHFINFFSNSSAGDDGFVQVLTVNTSTWVVTTASAVLEFDTSFAKQISSAQIDTNHFVTFWAGASGGQGWVQVFTVNTSTWAVTTAAASFNYTANVIARHQVIKIDTTHYLNVYSNQSLDNDGYAQVFTVDTSTWAVTTAAAALEWETDYGDPGSVTAIDENHFLVVFDGTSSFRGYAQVLTVNTSTWAVTTAAAALQFSISGASVSPTVKLDENHFLVTYNGADQDGFAVTLTVNTSTWAVTTAASALEYDTQAFIYAGLQPVDETHFLSMWSGDSQTLNAQVLHVDVPLNLSIDVNEAVTVTESVSRTRFSFINVNDAITVTDFPGYTPELVIVTEYVDVFIFTGTIEPDINDTITVSESVTLELTIPDISVSDSVTVDEATSFDFVRDMSVNDEITVSESVSVEIPNLAGVEVNDEITVSESVSVEINAGDVSVIEEVTVDESLTLHLQSSVDLSDNVSIAETVQVELFSNASVVDEVTVAEAVVVERRLNLMVIEAVTVAESVDVELKHDLSFGPPVGIGTEIWNHIPTTRNYS